MGEPSALDIYQLLDLSPVRASGHAHGQPCEVPDDMRQLPHIPELAVYEAPVHDDQLRELSSVQPPGNPCR